VRNRPRIAPIAMALVLLVAACGGDDEPAAEPTTTTTAPATRPSDGKDSEPPENGSGEGVARAWAETAQRFRGQVGSTQRITCPAGGSPSDVWGAGVYTDDSSVCTAAVQSGLITFAEGGEVTILIGPAQDSFDGGTTNGVTSLQYGPYDGSFTFPDAPPGSVDFTAGAGS
jgi:hypothetical protein